jgi:hypothetical protein
MPLGLATNAGDLEPWQRLVSLVVGLGVIAGAILWLAQNPATQVQLAADTGGSAETRWQNGT